MNAVSRVKQLLKSTLLAMTRLHSRGAYYLKGQPLLARQVKRHFEHVGLDSAVIHTRVMLPKISEVMPEKEKKILLIGCCNMLEVDAFLNAGYKNVVGIDLASSNPEYIKVMDMHNLKFEDGTFDLVYISGAFHCTHDPVQLTSEIARVLKSPGILVIGVPVNFETSEVYRYDVKSIENLCGFFSRRLEVKYHHLEPPRSRNNPHINEYMRAIIKFN